MSGTRGRIGAESYEQTREQLANRVSVPDLKKMGGQLLVPIAAMAIALDCLVDLESLGRALAHPLLTRHTVISATPLSTDRVEVGSRTVSKLGKRVRWRSGRRSWHGSMPSDWTEFGRT